ncbi:low molecular weight protein-tyrosine-phosphatase [Oryzifoliimicrobium ureilyticus]|uniref:low molecular weight protein-tyrosine-phosphatase n=1 Tax=Oryzifoliimicrobium ureilyticus TaxID=3113724 RepID=UPI003075F871
MSATENRFGVLFVCSGNICRSPLAEGIFTHLAEKAGLIGRFTIDSAGIGGWHVGQPPDNRAVATAKKHGIDISRQKARRLKPNDFTAFDLVLAMDRGHMGELRRLAPHSANIHLFGDLALETGEDIQEPYYGDLEDFELVYTRLLSGCRKLLEDAPTLSRNGKISSVR